MPLHDANSGIDGDRLQEQHIDSSPCSEDLNSGKAVSVSSPSIKSESDVNSPAQQLGGVADSIINSSSFRQDELPTLDEGWPYDDDVDAADLPVMLRSMINMDHGNAGTTTTTASATAYARQRFRSRLQSKVMHATNSILCNIPESNRGIGINELNQRITELKMEPGVVVPPSRLQLTELQPINNRPSLQGYATQLRRDSQTSNASTYYCSMQSRRSSQSSLRAGPIYNNNYVPTASSLYDPISPGCSRRSSQMSNVANTSSSMAHLHGTPLPAACAAGESRNSNSLPPPPSSHLISTQLHLQRLQQSSEASSFYQNQNQRTNQCGGGRYSIPTVNNLAYHLPELQQQKSQNMSTSTVTLRRQSEPVLAQQSVMLAPTTCQSNCSKKAYQASESTPRDQHHPNERVNLDEVEELILPDEMLQYLNLVKDGEKQIIKSAESGTPGAAPAFPLPQLMSTYRHVNMSTQDSPYAQRNEGTVVPYSGIIVPKETAQQQQQPSTYNTEQQIVDSSMTSLPELVTLRPVPVPATANNEIQCGDVSQSQLSPANFPTQHNPQPHVNLMQMTDVDGCSPANQEHQSSSMQSDTYLRTLEYVQSCQNWMETNSGSSSAAASLRTNVHFNHVQAPNTLWPDVSSSTHPQSHPSVNMIVNDMTTSLSSLLEENRYLQLMQ